METNLSEIVKVLEKEKCSFHKYRAMVFVENGEFRIIGCCKSFENFLEIKGQKMKTDQPTLIDKT
jgi:hypothetical protein